MTEATFKSSPPRFPAELEYAVINELDGDKPSLAICSLVCRAWRRPSQSLLFCYFTLWLSDSAWLSGPKFEELLQFFVDQRIESEPFPGFVRSLAVRADAQSLSSMWSFDLLRALVGCFPNLHTLSLHAIIFPGDNHHIWFPRIPPEIRSLTTPLCTLHKFESSGCASYEHTLLELLSMFTHIEKLRIVGGWWPASTLFTGTRQAVSPHIPSIHTLILEGCDASWASTLLESRRQSGHHLRAIHLRPDSIYELVSVGGHLQDMSAAQALVELHLDMSDRRHNDVIEGWDMHALLALCSSLERVTLTVSSQRYPFQDSTPVARVRIALGQLVSLLSTSPNSLPRLQFIAFTATEIPPMEWGTIRSLPEWSRFDEVVAGFAAVQHVDVSLHLEGCRNRPQEADGIEEWLRQVQNGMPRMVQGGLLKLQILGEEYQ